MPKKAKINPPSAKLLRLLHSLEYLIGSECYNGNIQNYGAWGEWEGEGREFRYPVRFRNSEGKFVKYRGEMPGKLAKTTYKYYTLKLEAMNSAHYAFGANQLYVFRGIKRMLEHLEHRFGLSFEELVQADSSRPKSQQ